MSTPDNLHWQDASALLQQLRSQEISSADLARHYLQRAQAHESLGAFVALAQLADVQVQDQPDGTLAGLPLACGDRIVTRKLPTSAGSRMLADYQSPFEATAVRKLNAAGARILGKLSGDEFGMGCASQLSCPVPAHNPWDASRVPGGAAGGAAAAVAAGLSPAAIAVDTLGDLRQPAALCGVTALRPSYGRISRHGLVASCSSMDQASVVARSARDCKLLLQILAGPDPKHDATVLDAEFQAPDGLLDAPLQGLRLGVPAQWLDSDLDTDVGSALQATLAGLEKLSIKRVPVSLPLPELHAAIALTLAVAEASSNLAAYDGVRFGLRAARYRDLEDMYEQTRAQGFGPEVKRRLLAGTWLLSQAAYESHYQQAQKARRMVTDGMARVFQDCDVLAAPVTACVAWPAQSPSSLGDDIARSLRFTALASLAGLPAMSVPAGFGAHGLPVGLQLIAPQLQEERLLHVAHQWQQASDFHLQHPEGL